jgi:hypothetical protein
MQKVKQRQAISSFQVKHNISDLKGDNTAGRRVQTELNDIDENNL